MTGKRAKGKYRTYRIAGVGVVGAGVIAGTLAAAGAFAGQGDEETPARTLSAQNIVCPSVEGLPAIPPEAQDEVTRNLELLDKQLAEANSRLARSQGEGGPNFVQNAILGPLEGKRTAALNRIETAIGRVAEKPEGLERFAPCALEGGNGADAGLGENGADGGEQEAGGESGAEAGAGSAPTVDCPDVASRLPSDIPAGAQGQVDRELAALAREIGDANDRLARSQGEGGPNFIDNAILGPLGNKRKAVIDRIEIAFKREGSAPPAGLDELAECRLNG
ncbi:hypothetical protein [Streptomyces marokkonensis]|uniref:hypothetical protein n=1 Tax=Streptomyces marokkonensis TaxID=324855 RepID=UPI001FCAE7A3|nr:hypothetical protein [Streptomyces marokkonensis]